MNSKSCNGIFTLIESSVTEFDLKINDGERVYSILALYKGDDFPKSEFIYDVSRDKSFAYGLIARLNRKSPDIDGLVDAVSEML